LTATYRTLTSPLFDVRVVDRAADAVAAVADDVTTVLSAKERRAEGVVLGLATGSTMVPLYDELARRHARGEVSFGRSRAVLLDEYRGLEPGHPERFVRWITRHLAERVDLPPEQIEVPPADAEGAELEGACDRFDRRLRALGGVDLQLLGLGRNGHVAFNEPGSPSDSRTRLVRLASSTREANAKSFGELDQVPTSAVTQGLATIRDARRLRMLVFGAPKREALARLLALDGFDPQCPASALAGHHDLVIWADAAAVD
jgi:glucosamine-6-phosphate deaminase